VASGLMARTEGLGTELWPWENYLAALASVISLELYFWISIAGPISSNAGRHLFTLHNTNLGAIFTAHFT
jgi:hypothetical protein